MKRTFTWKNALAGALFLGIVGAICGNAAAVLPTSIFPAFNPSTQTLITQKQPQKGDLHLFQEKLESCINCKEYLQIIPIHSHQTLPAYTIEDSCYRLIIFGQNKAELIPKCTEFTIQSLRIQDKTIPISPIHITATPEPTPIFKVTTRPGTNANNIWDRDRLYYFNIEPDEEFQKAFPNEVAYGFESLRLVIENGRIMEISPKHFRPGQTFRLDTRSLLKSEMPGRKMHLLVENPFRIMANGHKKPINVGKEAWTYTFIIK